MTDDSLDHRCRKAILDSPFEATVTAVGQGPLVQYGREACLQPTHTPGQVFLRCECGLEQGDVLLLVRVRDGFTFNGPIHISAGFSWHRDEQSVQHLTALGAINNATPILLSTVSPRSIGVGHLPGSHFYLHVHFDLASSAPPSAASDAPSTTCAAIEVERHELSRLQGDSLRDHICNPLPLPHCRNLEFVYKVARLRYEALFAEWQRDRSFELETTCDYLQSGLCDRLQGPHFEQRRKDLSADLMSLRSQNTPTKGTKRASAPSWIPAVGDTVMYRDDKAEERPVEVTEIIHGDEPGAKRYKISWVRQTERKNLAHRNGTPLKKEEVGSLRPGYELVYDGYDVSLLRVLKGADEADDENVPRLEIKIVRTTTKVSSSN